ncbi:MAG: GNAT family N-acetyltransferase [Acholeplasmataceae bacterium]
MKPIKTERFNIRPFLMKDLDTFMEYRNNESWMLYQDFKGFTKHEYAKMIIHDIPDIKKGLQLAIVDIDSDQVYGDLFLYQENESCWLGYTIHPKHARKGYTYEAILGVIPFLKEQGITLIKASAHPENRASLNLIMKLGFKEVGLEDNGDRVFEKNI